MKVMNIQAICVCEKCLETVVVNPKFNWYGRCPDNCTYKHKCDDDDLYLYFICPVCGTKNQIQINEYQVD